MLSLSSVTRESGPQRGVFNLMRYEITYKCGKKGKSTDTDKPELEIKVHLALSHLFNEGCPICLGRIGGPRDE